VLLVFAALGPQVLREPWNPYVALPAFAAVVLAAWGVAVGDRWQLPVAVVVGTFLVQVHIGYAILVGALLVAAGAMAFPWRRARGAAVRAWTRPAIAAGLAAVALWAAPLVEQTRDTPGNLRAIAAYVIHGRGTSVGFGHALGLLATEYRIPPPWLGATSPIALDRGATASANLWLLVPLALLVTAAVVARRRGDRSGGAIIGLLVVANVAGVVALASTTGVPYDYLFLWRTLLAPLTLLGAAWVLARAIAADRPAFRRVPIAALAVVLVVAAGVVTRDIVDAPAAVAPAEPFVSAAAAKLVPRAAGRRVMLRLAGPETRGVFAGLLDALDARGVDVRTSTSLAFVVGRDRATGRRGADVIWVVVEDSRLVSELLGNPAAKVLVRRTPLSQGEDRELTRVHRRLSAELRAAGRGDLVNTVGTPLVNIALADAPVDPDAVARATTLNRRVDESATGRVAVFEFAPDRIPALPPTPILGT
jgi:hypothetical protein